MIVGITGGSGFIGRHLVNECLSRGHQVKVLSRKQNYKLEGVDVCLGDLTDPQADLQSFVQDLDVLYHCAGEIKNEAYMQALHVEGTKQLLQAGAGKIGRWVQLSSVGAYGVQRSGLVDESTPVNPSGQYELTKTESDQLVANIAGSSNMQYTILRPSNVFGNDMPNQSLAGMLKMLKRGLFFYVGSQGAEMNYIHVSSVVRAMILCGEHEGLSGGTYIISDHIPLEKMIAAFSLGIGISAPTLRIPETVIRVLAAIFKIFPGIPLSKNRIDAMTGQARYDSSKLERELGYKEEVPLTDHFRAYAENWKSLNN